MQTAYFRTTAPNAASALNATAQRWNVSTNAFEDHDDANWSDYLMPTTASPTPAFWGLVVPTGAVTLEVYAGTSPSLGEWPIIEAPAGITAGAFAADTLAKFATSDTAARVATPGSVARLAGLAGILNNAQPILVDSERVAPQATWRVRQTPAGLVGDKAIGMHTGANKKLAIDFTEELPWHYRLARVTAVEIVEGTADGVTWSVGKIGVDGAVATLKLAAYTADRYKLKISALDEHGNTRVALLDLAVVGVNVIGQTTPNVPPPAAEPEPAPSDPPPPPNPKPDETSALQKPRSDDWLRWLYGEQGGVTDVKDQSRLKTKEAIAFVVRFTEDNGQYPITESDRLTGSLKYMNPADFTDMTSGALETLQAAQAEVQAANAGFADVYFGHYLSTIAEKTQEEIRDFGWSPSDRMDEALFTDSCQLPNMNQGSVSGSFTVDLSQPICFDEFNAAYIAEQTGQGTRPKQRIAYGDNIGHSSVSVWLLRREQAKQIKHALNAAGVLWYINLGGFAMHDDAFFTNKAAEAAGLYGPYAPSIDKRNEVDDLIEMADAITWEGMFPTSRRTSAHVQQIIRHCRRLLDADVGLRGLSHPTKDDDDYTHNFDVAAIERVQAGVDDRLKVTTTAANHHIYPLMNAATRIRVTGWGAGYDDQTFQPIEVVGRTDQIILDGTDGFAIPSPIPSGAQIKDIDRQAAFLAAFFAIIQEPGDSCFADHSVNHSLPGFDAENVDEDPYWWNWPAKAGPPLGYQDWVDDGSTLSRKFTNKTIKFHYVEAYIEMV